MEIAWLIQFLLSTPPIAKVCEAIYVVELECEGDPSLSINRSVPVMLQGALKPITCAAKYRLIELRSLRFCLCKLFVPRSCPVKLPEMFSSFAFAFSCGCM